MRNQIGSLKDEARLLKNMAIKLKAMEIEVQKMLIMVEQLSVEKLNLASELDANARVENLQVYEVRIRRPAKKRETKVYSYWYASWRMNPKVKNVCLGSTKKMTYDEALVKARRLKAECLGISY
jgi:hypothetical protein